MYEAQEWLSEKAPLVASADFGKDEDSVAALTKKLDNVARDLASFRQTIERLKTQCKKLTERNHFDTEIINSKMVR